MAAKGYQIDRKQVKISEQIKTLGEHVIHVKLHSEVLAPITLNITSDNPVIDNDSKNSIESRVSRGRNRGPGSAKKEAVGSTGEVKEKKGRSKKTSSEKTSDSAE